MQHALAVETDDSDDDYGDGDSDGGDDDEDLEEFDEDAVPEDTLASVCAGLVTVEHENVR